MPLVSMFGVLQSYGVYERISWIAHLTLAVIVTTAVCAMWAKPFSRSVKAAALSIALVIVTPYALGYDL
jgi:hypothetical protein